jgi:hypothetical protein
VFLSNRGSFTPLICIAKVRYKVVELFVDVYLDLTVLLSSTFARFVSVPGLPQYVSVFELPALGGSEGQIDSEVLISRMAILPVIPVLPYPDGQGAWNATSTG